MVSEHTPRSDHPGGARPQRNDYRPVVVRVTMVAAIGLWPSGGMPAPLGPQDDLALVLAYDLPGPRRRGQSARRAPNYGVSNYSRLIALGTTLARQARSAHVTGADRHIRFGVATALAALDLPGGVTWSPDGGGVREVRNTWETGSRPVRCE